jgi:hypothetical protein
VIKCIIKPGESVPSWQINGKPAGKEKLLALSAKLQIQPGNLCQFLPQVNLLSIYLIYFYILYRIYNSVCIYLSSYVSI